LVPLKQGSSKAAFSANVREMMNTGRGQKQALAIAFAQQRKKKGGGTAARKLLGK
jgi:hypothetical protein